MKSHTEYLWFNTKKHREFINITDQVEKALEKSKVKEGLILVSAMHITAGVYVNDHESGLIEDIDQWLEKPSQRVPITRISPKMLGRMWCTTIRKWLAPMALAEAI